MSGFAEFNVIWSTHWDYIDDAPGGPAYVVGGGLLLADAFTLAAEAGHMRRIYGWPEGRAFVTDSAGRLVERDATGRAVPAAALAN